MLNLAIGYAVAIAGNIAHNKGMMMIYLEVSLQPNGKVVVPYGPIQQASVDAAVSAAKLLHPDWIRIVMTLVKG